MTTTIILHKRLPGPDDDSMKVRSTVVKIDQSAWGYSADDCKFIIAFNDTIRDNGSLESAKKELILDSKHMFDKFGKKEMSIEYPANLVDAEFETFREEIQSEIPSVKLIFIKSKWIHTASGWVEMP